MYQLLYIYLYPTLGFDGHMRCCQIEMLSYLLMVQNQGIRLTTELQYNSPPEFGVTTTLNQIPQRLETR